MKEETKKKIHNTLKDLPKTQSHVNRCIRSRHRVEHISVQGNRYACVQHVANATGLQNAKICGRLNSDDPQWNDWYYFNPDTGLKE
jgi:hypothetical protein